MSTQSIWSLAEEAAEFIGGKTALRPKLALVLGSGLGAFADELEERVVLPYSAIPHFPVSTAEGHAGNLSDPKEEFPLREFCKENDLPYADVGL